MDVLASRIPEENAFQRGIVMTVRPKSTKTDGKQVMGKIRFVTLYPECSEIQLVKDVGQIPRNLAKNEKEIEVVLAGCHIQNHTIFNNFCLEKITSILGNVFLSGLLYVLWNARKVDWFNFYHGGRKVVYWTKLYKFLNPKGKVFLKLDLNFDGCNKILNNKRDRTIFNRVQKEVDLITVESTEVLHRIKPVCKKDVYILSNGYEECDELQQIREFDEKERAFITVARLGDYSKATDILLEAFAKSAPKHDWILKMVGPVEKEFDEYIERYFIRYPELKNRIEFVGAVTDRNKLYEMYNCSRVFVLPSRWEGFPISGVEALSCGCRVILSDGVPPIHELSNGGKYGRIVKKEDIDSLAEALLEETKREGARGETLEIAAYAEQRFSWKNICRILIKWMMQ